MVRTGAKHDRLSEESDLVPSLAKRPEAAATRNDLSQNRSSRTAQLSGTEPWTNITQTTDGSDLSQMSKPIAKGNGLYSWTHTVYHDEPFTLEPLTLTKGPFKGSHIFLMRLHKESFHFWRLSPELRLMVYEFLLTPTICPMERNGNCGVEGHRRGMHPHILSTCKGIRREAAPILYGHNRIDFGDLSECLTFLTNISTTILGEPAMIEHLRRIRIHGAGGPRGFGRLSGGYMTSKARAVFHVLKNARRLELIELDQDNLCGPDARGKDHRASLDTVVADMSRFLALMHQRRWTTAKRTVAADIKRLPPVLMHRRHQTAAMRKRSVKRPAEYVVGEKSPEEIHRLPNVLDLVKITNTKCAYCQHTAGAQCPFGQRHYTGTECLHASRAGTHVPCWSLEGYCNLANVSLRREIARALGIAVEHQDE